MEQPPPLCLLAIQARRADSTVEMIRVRAARGERDDKGRTRDMMYVKPDWGRRRLSQATEKPLIRNVQTNIPPSAIPRNTLVIKRPVYDLTKAVPIAATPKLVIMAASQTDPKCLSARFEGISANIYYEPMCEIPEVKRRMNARK